MDPRLKYLSCPPHCLWTLLLSLHFGNNEAPATKVAGALRCSGAKLEPTSFDVHQRIRSILMWQALLSIMGEWKNWLTSVENSLQTPFNRSPMNIPHIKECQSRLAKP